MTIISNFDGYIDGFNMPRHYCIVCICRAKLKLDNNNN